ncbi:hypothetical protein N9055_01285 [Akkermansiaceae bacterium]|nr:hypothetical protein [Akkermansiaceae bacterium]MDB4308624.1 hypothetical protein [bacterium]MDB4304703.1 hypothetical protein [Akkermansiaceae bacterium]MDB4451683.1 hypothetical protein [Akkermansiaceae bacterium]MDB4506830.1 hypothetical protein [Akkermansiaceae bacterium]
MALTQAVKDKIQWVFSSEHEAEASELIQKHCGFSLPCMQTIKPEDYDRIRFAVMKLSEGSIEKLRNEIGEAHIDWRDVLTGAGFGGVEKHLEWDPEPKG